MRDEGLGAAMMESHTRGQVKTLEDRFKQLEDDFKLLTGFVNSQLKINEKLMISLKQQAARLDDLEIAEATEPKLILPGRFN